MTYYVDYRPVSREAFRFWLGVRSHRLIARGRGWRIFVDRFGAPLSLGRPH